LAKSLGLGLCKRFLPEKGCAYRAVASPGICPFCLDDATLSAAERMHQFHDKVEWRDHISDHFEILKNMLEVCMRAYYPNAQFQGHTVPTFSYQCNR
jgi:hypothetical protein